MTKFAACRSVNPVYDCDRLFSSFGAELVNQTKALETKSADLQSFEPNAANLESFEPKSAD